MRTVQFHRRTLITGTAVTAVTALSGCSFMFGPRLNDAVEAIKEAPHILDAELGGGPGGGLGENLRGDIRTDVSVDDLAAVIDTAWRRGVEVLRDVYGEQSVTVGVSGFSVDGIRMRVKELLPADPPNSATLKHFYDLYGID